jgi:ATP-binding cassette, subfamily B, bacterial PglK
MARAKYLHAAATQLPPIVIETALLGFILLYFGLAIARGDQSQETLSILGLFGYVGLRLQPSLQLIVGGLNALKFAAAPLEDLHADLLAVEALPETPRTPDPCPSGPVSCWRDVTFQYEETDRPALSGIDLTIRPGEQIGICGPTGGGKTTLVDVITGLLQPTSGTVTVDGADLREHDRAWQRNLGVVPQMVFLTDDTFRHNIAFGVPDDEIDQTALDEAIDSAQLREFVDSLPEGLETVVGERGVRISGGQRQRIAIARALYHRPSVLVFDEGTSALDNTTEALLMESIERLRGDHTIILIAHRLSTVRSSDRVVFIEAGRISGQGTYDELVAENAAFRQLAAVSQ